MTQPLNRRLATEQHVADELAQGTTPNGGAGGALSGSYPNPGLNVAAVDTSTAANVNDSGSNTAAALRAAYAQAPTAPVSGGMARWDGTTWQTPQGIQIVTGNTSAAIQNAINNLPAQGGIVYLLPINYDITSTITVNKNNVIIQGAGRNGTQLLAKSDLIVFDLSGTAASHRHRLVLRDLTIDGGDDPTWNTQPMVRAYYLDTSNFWNVNFQRKWGVAFQTVEMWDCTFYSCRWDNCGGTDGTKPATLFLNQDNVGNTGFGGSTDTTNEVHFYNCSWETGRDGGIWILGDAYGSTRVAEHFEFIGCKWDANNAAVGPYMKVTQATNLHFTDLSTSINGAGPSWDGTKFDLFSFSNNCRDVTLAGNMLFNGVQVARTGVSFDGTSSANSFCSVTDLVGSANSSGGPSVALLEWKGTNNWSQQARVGWRRSSGGYAAVSGRPTTVLQGQVVAIKAGVPVDADYTSGGLPNTVFDGMGPVIDSTSGKAYYRVGGAWVTGSPSGGAGTTSLVGGHTRTSAVENGPRWTFLTSTQTIVAGRAIFSYVTPDADQVITKLAYSTASTAAAGATLIRFGLYTVDGSGNLTLVARTASDTAIFNATATEFSRSLDATGGYPTSYTMLAGTRYAIGVVVVGASTQPVLAGPPTMNTAAGNSAPKIFGRLDSQTDLPTSVATGSVVNSLAGFYAAGLA